VGAVGAISADGTYSVGMGSTPVEAFQKYLQKLFSETASKNLPVASNQTAQEKLAKNQQLEKVFTEAGLTIIKPTAIDAPLEFKEAQTTYRTQSDFAQAETAIHTFIERFVPHGDRVFEWENGTSINFSVLLEVDGIVENHYISIEVGN